MNSKANVSSNFKQNVSEKRSSSSDKENNGLAIAKISSGKTVEELINGMRISACKTITNVKSSFGGLSNRLRKSTIKSRKFTRAQQYEELGEQVTPVKLYSPFTFVTPSPVKNSRKKLSPKRFTFASPTGKFQKDVQQLSQEVKELEKLEKSLRLRRVR